MSILSGFLKTKKYRKINGKYQLQSEWTNANSLEFDDGNTAQTNLGDIKGITDSLTATSSNVALSSKAGNNLQTQISQLNTDLGTIVNRRVPIVLDLSGETRWTADSNGILSIKYWSTLEGFGCNITMFDIWNFIGYSYTTPEYATFYLNKGDSLELTTTYARVTLYFTPIGNKDS